MKKIILDTNFLVYCTEKKIDYKFDIENISGSGYLLIVPRPVILELELIFRNAKKYSDKRAAKLALDLVEHNRVEIIETKTNIADDAVIELAKENPGSIVASMDVQLRQRLKGISKMLVVNSKKELGFA